MRLAIIPARGGSKRIPRKNIKAFCGRPMIAWSIEAALTSGCFDHVVVSTDDPEIAEVASKAGASVPFMRPPNLSGDFTGTIPVIQHAIETLEKHFAMPASVVCCLYATAPFVQADDLRKGLAALTEQKSDYAFSVTSFPFPIQRAIRILDSGRVTMFYPEYMQARSQDLDEAYHDAGQFYWGTAGAWKAGRAIFSEGAVPVLLPRHRVQDIDTLEDWERAQWLFNAWRAGA